MPEAVGGKTVIGQLTVDRVDGLGIRDRLWVRRRGAAAGGEVTKSDLNYDGTVTPAASNRLIVQADADGDVCFLTRSAVDLIVDLNAVSGVGITSFPNQRTDTRTGTTTAELPSIGPVPVWPPFTPAPALNGVAALTGRPAGADVTNRPIVAIKIDNFRLARPQLNLDLADGIIEENVEGVTRFVALFQTNVPEVGPVRSARTSDLDLLTGMNRPIFGFSGANVGVTAWVTSAASSGVLGRLQRPALPVLPTGRRSTGAAQSARRPPVRGRDQHIGRARATALDHRPGLDAARRHCGRRRHDVPGDDGRRQDRLDLGPDDRDVSALPGRRRPRRRVRRPDHGRLGGRTVRPPRAVAGRQSLAQPDLGRDRPGVVHRDGRAIAVTWSRPTAYDAFTFNEVTTGAPVPVDEGRTFVELVRDA